jgi:hypothetical protein
MLRSLFFPSEDDVARGKKEVADCDFNLSCVFVLFLDGVLL